MNTRESIAALALVFVLGMLPGAIVGAVLREVWPRGLKNPISD